MNQDQLRFYLTRLNDKHQDFAIVFSGKESDKTGGLYKWETQEIIIHNRNFSEDLDILKEGIRQYAKHLYRYRFPDYTGENPRGTRYQLIVQELMAQAEREEILKAESNLPGELAALVNRIKVEFLAENGKLMKEFGRVMQDASKLCKKYRIPFEEFTNRFLGIEAAEARTAMKVARKDIDAGTGYTNMKKLASMTAEKRQEAEAEIERGISPSLALEKMKHHSEEDARLRLESERIRLQKSIENMRKKLDMVEQKLAILN
jgi:hypothetical protein